MNQVNHLLLRAYPARWRARYGDEFEALLAERPLGPFDIADILLGALDAQLKLRGLGAASEHRRGFSMSLRIGGGLSDGLTIVAGTERGVAMSWTIESVQVADVDPAAVFRLYADPTTWASWGHNATRARSEGPLTEGGVVHVRANYGRDYPCRIRRFEAGRALELEVRPPLLFIVNVYEVERTAEGARIRHALEFSGPISGVMKLAGVGMVYRRQLRQEVARVIDLAKRDTPST